MIHYVLAPYMRCDIRPPICAEATVFCVAIVVKKPVLAGPPRPRPAAPPAKPRNPRD